MIHELPGNCEYNIALGWGVGGNHNVSVAMIIVYAN